MTARWGESRILKPSRWYGKRRLGIGGGGAAYVPPPEPDTNRYGWGALGNTQYDDIAGQQARFSGDPAYAFWFSQASITQTKITNWRTAFPGSTIIAYLILFNLIMEPEPDTTYYGLVQALDDRWLRLQSDDSKVEYGGGLGYYFWNEAMITDVLLPWLSETGNLKSWLTKYDGFFLDNLNFTSGYGQWAAEAALGVKVAGENQDEAGLISLYDRIPAWMVAGIRSILFPDDTKIIMPNCAAYSDAGGVVPVQFVDSNVNGFLWEPVDIDNILNIFSGPDYPEPQCKFQFVNSEPNWTTIQAATYPAGVGFMQGGSFRPTGRLP